MKKQPTEAQLAGYRKHCLNGVCKMTPEERRARQKLYHERVLADPFRRQLYTDYFRKRRAKPGMREKTNAIGRATYHRDIEKSRAYCREKYHRMMDDPVRHAAYLERKRKRNRGADGQMSAARKREQLKLKLIPHWEIVVRDGTEAAYLRRARPENARLFRLWRDNYAMFEQMLKSSYKTGGRA